MKFVEPNVEYWPQGEGMKKDYYDHSKCERFIHKVTELSHEYGFVVKWKQSIRKLYEVGLPLLKLTDGKK